MKERVFESTSKYVTKYSGELAGRVYRLVMDNGREYVIRFLSVHTFAWAERGEDFRWEKYNCLQSDSTTYFVVSELYGRKLRTCLSIVLDLAAGLVTMHWAEQGGVPGRPRLVETKIVFGAIAEPGKPLAVKRHAYTSELAGKKIAWTYSSGFVNTHIYLTERYCRCWAQKRPEAKTAEEQERARAGEEREKTWLYEEPCNMVKIKDRCYLLSFIEENMNKVDNLIGGNNLVKLANMAEGFDVGRTFCLNAEQKPESGMFVAYGEFVEGDLEVEHLPSPYRV